MIEISDDILEEIEKKTKKQTMEDLVIKLKDHLAITKSTQEPLFETYSLHQLYKCCDVYRIKKNPLL